jgi:hypothetical protein
MSKDYKLAINCVRCPLQSLDKSLDMFSEYKAEMYTFICCLSVVSDVVFNATLDTSDAL